MRSQSQVIPSYGLPVVRELPMTLEPVAPETFGGLTSTPSTVSPRSLS
jgi:hypothetical protein